MQIAVRLLDRRPAGARRLELETVQIARRVGVRGAGGAGDDELPRAALDGDEPNAGGRKRRTPLRGGASPQR